MPKPPLNDIVQQMARQEAKHKMDGYPEVEEDEKQNSTPPKATDRLISTNSLPPQIRSGRPLLPSHVAHPARSGTRIAAKTVRMPVSRHKPSTWPQIACTARPRLVRWDSQEPAESVRHDNALARIAAPLRAEPLVRRVTAQWAPDRH
jgi:hypothetical protein